MFYYIKLNNIEKAKKFNHQDNIEYLHKNNGFTVLLN